MPALADLSDWESLRVQLDLPDVVEDTAELAPDIPDLPMIYAENEEEESDDELSARMSDAEIDAVNKRIPGLCRLMTRRIRIRTRQPALADIAGLG